MKNKLLNFPSCILLLLALNLINSQSAFAQSKAPDKSSRAAITLAKATDVDRPFWTPNRIGTSITNTGSVVDFHTRGSAGMEWPVGSGNTIVFQDGIWIAGIKDGEIVTAAAEFATEFQPGHVTGHAPGIAGTPADPNDDRFKVYIIDRKDISNPARNPDYLSWPVDQGAPVDENGKPLLLGTSTAWTVFNDFNDSLHTNMFQTKPMGVEVQMAAWGFDLSNALGDMLFIKYKIINKSGRDIDSTYVGFWSDPDIGDAMDKGGCDTTLSLGFNYKTQTDGLYGENPPAIGYTFLQGPIVPSSGDVAYGSHQQIPDFKNLAMTAFMRFISGGPPRIADPENGLEAYRFMSGRDAFGDPFIDALTGEATNFWVTGDPVTGTGWLDQFHGDKKFLMSSGPFFFPDGGAQEIVLGIIIAQGSTGLESVRLLKLYDAVAQRAFDANFALPESPPAPQVMVSPSENAIFLTWDKAAETYEARDGIDIDSSGAFTKYTFQGYNVYQLDSPILGNETRIKKIAGFDMIDGVVEIRDDVFEPETGDVVNRTVQDAQDTGLQRFLRITEDALNNNEPLVLFRPYYFAVTAYGYNPVGIPKTLEGPIEPLVYRPQSVPLGTQLHTQVGDSLEWTHVSGMSDGSIQPIIVAPGLVTGDDYEVRFRKTKNGMVYDIWNIMKQIRVDSNDVNQSNALGTEDYPIVDGVKIIVDDGPKSFKNFEVVANANGLLDPPEGAALPSAGFPSREPTTRQQVGEGIWLIHTGDSGFRSSFEDYINRVTNSQTRWPNILPYDYEIRFTEEGSFAYDVFFSGDIIHVPFELWRIGIDTPDDPADDVRMVPYIIDWDQDKIFNLSGWGDRNSPAAQSEHSVSDGKDDPQTDWFYWAIPDDQAPGDIGYRAWEAAALALPLSPCSGLPSSADEKCGNTSSFYNILAKENTMRRMVMVNWNGGEMPPFNQDLPEEGTVFRITTTKLNTPEDVFAFSTPAQIRNDLALAREQAAALVNVFPNPYDRGSINLRNPTNQRVTFTHLPESDAIIRIYSLFGDLVRKIAHDNGTQLEFWDLRNEDGRTVASGLYIVHIDMGEIGVKVLKLAVF